MRTLNNMPRKINSGLRNLSDKQRTEREMDEELDAYIDASAEHKQRLGLSAEAARRAALIEMGSRNSVKQQLWSTRWEATVDGIWQDVRLSVRMLAKSPGFTLVAVLSLALGIGANTAIFTLLNQVLLKPLPVHDPAQLVTFGPSFHGGVLGGVDLGFFDQYPWYFARRLQENPGPFQGIAAYGSFSPKASVRPPAENGRPSGPAILVPTSLVSGNYFSVIGAQPLMGRVITPFDDAAPGSGAVVVVSYHFWQQQLSSDPAILGKSITINGAPFTVIGVMPESFHGIKQELEPPDLWTPVSMQSQVMATPSFLTRQGPYFLHIFARLNPQAAVDKNAFEQTQAWLNQQLRAGIRENEGAAITPERQQEINRASQSLVSAAHGVSGLRNQYGDSLKILMCVVAIVLLIACANLANFLLARAASRQHEIGTRLALGSSRTRIVRQSLVETLLLSFTGGLLGLGIAFAATRVLIGFVSQGTAYTAMSPVPDLTVLLFTLGVCLLTAVLFGLTPALTAARAGAASMLTSNTRTAQSAGGRNSRFWPNLLVTAQVMFSLLLLVGAGLFLRTLRNLQNQDFGFDRSHLLVAYFDARLVGYKPSQVPALHQQLLDRIEALPGVRSAALAATAPISGGNWTSSIKLSGYAPAPKENMVALLNRVSGKYFETSGISMVAGRPITPADSATSMKVAVVNETLARHYYPKGDAIGRTLTIDTDSVRGPWQIVGIARDTKSQGPRDAETARMAYIPIVQIEPYEYRDPNDKTTPLEENGNRFANVIVVRTTADPARTIADLRRAVAAVDPNLPLLNVHTIQEEVENFMSHEQLISSLTGIFSVLALLLAAIGLYGVMSYSVVRRTNEIGIRLALGAQTRTLLWMVLRESLVLLALGLAIGLPLTLVSTRLIREQLFGLSATDPMTFALAIVVVAAMTLLAAWLPARRATKVDPMVALRCD
jgi:predicted permease